MHLGNESASALGFQRGSGIGFGKKKKGVQGKSQTGLTEAPSAESAQDTKEEQQGHSPSKVQEAATGLKQTGEVAALASKCKATRSEFDPGTQYNSLDILNLLSDDTLLAIARTCDIDVGEDSGTLNYNLRALRGVYGPRSRPTGLQGGEGKL